MTIYFAISWKITGQHHLRMYGQSYKAILRVKKITKIGGVRILFERGGFPEVFSATERDFQGLVEYEFLRSDWKHGDDTSPYFTIEVKLLDWIHPDLR